jgi:flagellar biosynthesis protein FlhF
VVPIDGLLFTKLDETAQLGTILSGALAAQLPLTYFTTGQNVPDDIELAGIEGLMHRMLSRTAPAVPVQTG